MTPAPPGEDLPGAPLAPKDGAGLPLLPETSFPRSRTPVGPGDPGPTGVTSTQAKQMQLPLLPLFNHQLNPTSALSPSLSLQARFHSPIPQEAPSELLQKQQLLSHTCSAGYTRSQGIVTPVSLEKERL